MKIDVDANEIRQAEIDALDDLDDDAFRSTVAGRLDALPGNTALWRLLCHPTLVDRTLGCIEELAEELEQDTRQRRLPSTHHKTKKLNVVNNRLRMVSSAAARADCHAKTTEDELTIYKHCIELGLSPESHDLALWEQLDELRLPARGREEGGPSLAEMIADGHWQHPQAVDRG